MLVVVGGHEHDIGVVMRRAYGVDKGLRWQPGRRFELGPGLTAIVGDVDPAIVGSGEQEPVNPPVTRSGS